MTSSRLPASKSQLARLGKRLVAGELRPGDRELYAAVLDAYDRVQTSLVESLRGADWSSTAVLPRLHIVGRTKTLDTLVQKLRRTPEVQLPYVRDIAGVRIVGDMTPAQQSGLGIFLTANLPAQSKGLIARGHLIDRRAEPQAGYRALHAVLAVDGLPVEVQIRTRLQHLWAEVFERLADQWGRQIRYDGTPDPPDPGSADSLDQRIHIIDRLQKLSLDVIAPLEDMADSSQLSIEQLADFRTQVERALLEMVNILNIDVPGDHGGTTLEES